MFCVLSQNYQHIFEKLMSGGGGGTDLERGMRMCGPEDPFHASPAVRKGPI